MIMANAQIDGENLKREGIKASPWFRCDGKESNWNGYNRPICGPPRIDTPSEITICLGHVSNEPGPSFSDSNCSYGKISSMDNSYNLIAHLWKLCKQDPFMGPLIPRYPEAPKILGLSSKLN